MTRAIAVAIAASLAACGPASDHFQIQLELTQGSEYRCEQPVCSAVVLSCNSVLSVRIVDAGDPSTVYVSKCLSIAAPSNLCAIGSIDLGMNNNPVPNKMVRIEVMVWTQDDIDKNGGVCPTDVQFDANNMPVEVSPAPAIGGQTYFQVGSGDVATVDLGCIDLAALSDPSCQAPGTVDVRTSVADFDSGVVLATSIADTVTVGVGEPVAQTNPTTQQIEWHMEPSQIIDVPRNLMATTVPEWENATVQKQFQRAACLQVLEDGPQETPAITCHAANKDTRLFDQSSYRLAKSTLAQAFGVLRLPGVPDQGLVVGMVVDGNGIPLAGVSVTASPGTITYVSADRMGVDPGSVTTASGMFVSRDVPFDAVWSVTDMHGNQPVEKTPIGGLVVGKATVMFLQIEAPTGQ